MISISKKTSHRWMMNASMGIVLSVHFIYLSCKIAHDAIIGTLDINPLWLFLFLYSVLVPLIILLVFLSIHSLKKAFTEEESEK